MSTVRCPCLSGETYDGCCGRLHRGELRAPTAEALMRSRYSAFATGDAQYLLRTWHTSARPAELTLDPGMRWYRLDVLGCTRGGPFDTAGTVEFRAYYRSPPPSGEPGAARVATTGGVQHENSRFVREDGAWVYLDGVA